MYVSPDGSTSNHTHGMHYFPVAAITHDYKLGDLTEFSSLTFLETGSPNSSFGRATLCPEALGKNLLLASSSLGWLWASIDVPWFVTSSL